MKNLRTKLRLGAVGLVFLIAGSAWAATRTWTGGGDGTSWSDPANWGGTAPGSSDGVSFPNGTTVVIAMPSTAYTSGSSGVFTLGTGCSIRLNGVSSDVVHTFKGNVTIPADSLLTISNCGFYFNNATASNYKISGGLTITDGAVFQIAAGLEFTTNLIIEKKSTFKFDRNITIKSTAVMVLDDSEITPSGGSNTQIKLADSAKLVFRGKSPCANITVLGANSDSATCHLEFCVPAGGYDRIPFISANDKEVPDTKLIYCSVSPDSPAYASDTDKVVPLIATSKGIGYADKLYKMKLDEITDNDHPADTIAQWMYLTTQLSDADVSQGSYPQQPEDWKSPYPQSSVSRNTMLTLGVYIKGVPPPPEYAAPTFTEPVVTGGKGRMTAATTVTLDENADMAVDTASITFRYRPAASQDDGDWLTVTQPLTVSGAVEVELPVAGLADETDYTVEVTTEHVIGGTDVYPSKPVTVTPVTVLPAALAPTFGESALVLTGGADGASFAVEVSVAAFDESFVAGGNDTATAYMRYRLKDPGAEWTVSAESPIDATTMKAELSATIAKVTEDTVYEVEVWTKHVIGGYTYLAKTPATGEVTVSKPADTLPGFGETALAPKENGVTATAITLMADIEKLGDGANSATVTLMIRESGSLDAGTVADTKTITSDGKVELTVATGLEPGGSYELWVVVENDEGQSVECGKITVTTAPAAPTFGDSALTVTTVGINSISVSANIAALGAKSVPCDVALYVREAGETGDGTAKATTQVTIAGAVALTATGLDEETAYEVRVVAKHSAEGFADAVAATEWISVTTDATPPAFGAFAPDGASGDTLVVTGAMRSAGTVVVQVSTTEDFAAIYAEQSAGLIATDATFVQSFHAEKGVADYIAPGETYFVRLIATKGMHAVTSAVKPVTMVAASGVEVTGYAHANGTVTITGRVNPLGAGTSTVHILWGNDGMNFANDEKVEVSAATGAEWTFTKTGYTDFFCYRIYVENSCLTENWATTPVLGTGSETPTDQTDTYYWKADANGGWSGNWEDPVHWEACDSSGNPITGYHADWPDQKEFKKFSFSRIPVGSEVTVNLPARAMSWGTMTEMPGRANASLTLKGTPNKTVITFANTSSSIRTMGLNGETLVLDGLSLIFPIDFNMTSYDQTLIVKNDAVLKLATADKSKSFRLATTNLKTGHTNNVIIADAMIDMSGTNDSGAFWIGEVSGGVVNVIFRGKNPQLKAETLASTASTAPNVIFEIPEGGYAATPIIGGNATELGYRRTSGKPINYLIARDSPILQQKLPAKSVTYDLIDWAAGIDTGLAVLDSNGEKVKLANKDGLWCHYDDATNPTKIQVELTRASKGLVFVIYEKQNQ